MNNLMKGHLRIVILNSLEEGAASGSEIMNKLEKEFGWRPSCGSVYPVLNSLEEEKFTKVESKDSKYHKKIYSLTKKGKTELKNKQSEKNNLADEIIRIHKMVASLYNVDMDKMHEMIAQMKEGKIPFAQVHEEVEDLKMELFRILSEDLLDENSEKIRKILIKTTSELRKIKKSQKNKSKKKVLMVK